MHNSRSDSAPGKISLKEKVKVLEVSGRKQDSDERGVVPHEESEVTQRVESIENVGTESGKQDDEAVGRRERAGTKGSVGQSENDWKNVGGYRRWVRRYRGGRKRKRGERYLLFGLRVGRYAVNAKARPGAGRNNYVSQYWRFASFRQSS